jgi:hypothetical protein
MFSYKIGAAFVALGIVLLVGQFLIDPNQPPVRGFWTPRQQKTRMIIGGTIIIIYGIVEILADVLR